jgi:hypothetical protein
MRKTFTDLGAPKQGRAGERIEYLSCFPPRCDIKEGAPQPQTH